jgi:2-polyprenyl-3-methyl-5-hydroxy-6-metoxy-1,4-benzoquinol methylase
MPRLGNIHPDDVRPDDIRRHFDHRAPHYDNPVTAFIGEYELRVIRPLAPPGSTVLDYGCGTGRTTLDLLRRGCRVTAYDLSGAMLALAHAQAQVEGFSAEFTTDPAQLTGRQWLLVTCIGVLDYYADPLPLLVSLAGYLAPAGRLVVTYPNALSPLGWLYALGSRLRFPIHPQTERFARRVATQAGLQVSFTGYAFPAWRMVGHTLVVGMEKPSG